MYEETLNAVQEGIFGCDHARVPQQVADVLERIIHSGMLQTVTPDRLTEFNLVMAALLEGLQMRDFLRIADIIEYELRPWLAEAAREAIA